MSRGWDKKTMEVRLRPKSTILSSRIPRWNSKTRLSARFSTISWCRTATSSRQVEIKAASMRPGRLVRVGSRPDRPIDYRNDRSQTDSQLAFRWFSTRLYTTRFSTRFNSGQRALFLGCPKFRTLLDHNIAFSGAAEPHHSKTSLIISPVHECGGQNDEQADGQDYCRHAVKIPLETMTCHFTRPLTQDSTDEATESIMRSPAVKSAEDLGHS